MRVKIDELRRFAGEFADPLQFVMVDVIGDEALFVLQFHRVEHAAVGINPDQGVMLW